MQEVQKKISEILFKEPNLLFYTESEIKKDLEDGRGITIFEKDKLVGFCFLHSYADWLELSSMYVQPEFRGKGYLKMLIGELEKKVRLIKKKTFLFTRSPIMEHTVERFGFKHQSYFKLSLRVWLEILKHRLAPHRIKSYIKFIKLLSFPRAKLFIHDNL